MPDESAVEPRVVTIEGRKVIEITTPPAIPPSLDLLLRHLEVTFKSFQSFGGWRPDCGDGNHRLETWLEGRYDGLRLRLSRCLDCETCEVRDVSFDFLHHVKPGTERLRRRSKILGWYTGSRKNQRVYT